ncbi:hypothetical protein BDV41DRAFT_572176 [Aspergillus transmontanensis]|uniref:Uncharacterized protein n=1 Tax=Aspergillus transmontanensis TaxID=1034304 RepID=A0A5N6WBD8_9EURO|nr:hypothetical protein BDV41DRAFT_572176 [Aspergillus transmontanensis]
MEPKSQLYPEQQSSQYRPTEQLLLHLAFKEIQPFTVDSGLGVQADLTTQQGLRSYRGYAGIKTRHLTFEEQGTLWSKPFDQKNVERLPAIFDEVGCQPLEPDHHIAAIISDEILRTSLELSHIAGTDLMDTTNPPSLRLPDNTLLLCLYGKHHISLEAKTQLREDSPDAQGFQEGDVFRIYRQYKRQNNGTQAKTWYMRLQSDERRKIVRRLEQNDILCAAFDELLHYIGPWDPVDMSQIKCVLGLFNQVCGVAVWWHFGRLLMLRTWLFRFHDQLYCLLDTTSG